jgi:UDP-galactopyranose mutase
VSKTAEYHFVIVGSGLFGAVCARELTDAGFHCLVLDKRSHIAGNVYTENVNGIDVHKYGAHIFHTNDKTIWDYVNRFTEFNNYEHRVEVNYKNELYSFPINLKTLQQVWDLDSEDEALSRLDKLKSAANESNLESWAISQIGEELYSIFVKGYTEKQWGKSATDLPSSIIKRIPIRSNTDDRYFDDTYQGIPKQGYTNMVQNMLEGIDIQLDTDFFIDQSQWESKAEKIIFTGAIDGFFNYQFGPLEYRSLRFEAETIEQDSFQSRAVINYTDSQIPYTRIIEHKHFNPKDVTQTVITKEYPQKWEQGKERFYPIRDAQNTSLYNQYKALANQQEQYVFGGRLAEYRYYDMHQVIASALTKSKRIIKELKTYSDEA